MFIMLFFSMAQLTALHNVGNVRFYYYCKDSWSKPDPHTYTCSSTWLRKCGFQQAVMWEIDKAPEQNVKRERETEMCMAGLW